MAEEKLSLFWVKNILFGGDRDSWIISGIDYFPFDIYLLCLYCLLLAIGG